MTKVEAKNFYDYTSPEKKTATTSSEKDSIKYAQSSYTCNEGETIDTIIRSYSSRVSTVKNFDRKDTSIATVEKNPELAVKCADCLAVRITCKKEETTKLTVTSSTKASTTVKLTVTE